MGKNKNFWDSYKDFTFEEKNLKLLPLCHNTESKLVEQIVDDKKFQRKNCKYLKKKVSFFFYGNPYFFSDDYKLPVILAFSLKDEKSYSLFKFVPFDSGSNILLKKYFKSSKIRINIEQVRNEFILSESNPISFIRKHISFYFSDNENYFKAEFLHNKRKVRNQQAYSNSLYLFLLWESLKASYNKKGLKYLDQRAFSIEAHAENEIYLKDLKIEFFYGPESQKDYVKKNFENGSSAIIETYDGFDMDPSYIIQKGVDRFEKFLRYRKLL